MSPFPVRMEDHWSAQPGVDPGRAQLMWLMLVGDNPQVAELVRLGQSRLAGLPATRVATGRDGKLYSEPWIPHITLAYSNAAGPAGPVIEAMGRELPRQQAAITSISLVSQTPEQRWTWHPVTDVAFGTGIPSSR